MEEAIGLNLGFQSYIALLLITKLARACCLSDTLYGNLIRYHHAVDPEVLLQLEVMLEQDKNKSPLAVNEVAVLNIIAACDIVRKMFACDAFDVITKDLGIAVWEKGRIDNLIDFSNHLINDLIKDGTFRQQIAEVLAELDEKIQPV